jgi:hypothetical protein
MGKLPAQLKETIYSFWGMIKGHIAADEDDEVRTTVKPQICAAASEY